MILEIGGLALFLAVAVFLLVPIFRSARRQEAQNRWLRVRGEVLWQRVLLRGTTGHAQFFVRYAIDGRTYEEIAEAPDGLGYTHYGIDRKVRRAVDRRMARRPAGSRIEVMVDPENHARVLFVEGQLPARALAYAFTALFFVFFALFVLFAFDFL